MGYMDLNVELCGRLRQLNTKSRRDAFRMEESLDALTGVCWFSILDLANGYKQVPHGGGQAEDHCLHPIWLVQI